MVLNINFEEAKAKNKMTEAKVLKQKVTKLSDPRFILRLVGLGQIMVSF